jgi:hypothetical protein
VSDAPTQEDLEAAHCWEADDRIPGQPATTDLRRRLRYHQARWREAKGHPMGSQPLAPRPGQKSRPVGSRLPLDYARGSGATFVSPAALAAARARTSTVEAHQSIDHQRIWADLLWSPALAFNLFGDLAADLRQADRAVHTWWPGASGTVSDVRFAHSPGRLDPQYLNSLRDFAAAFVLDRGDGTRGILGVDVKYHDYFKPGIPKPRNLPRNLEVARRSRAFRRGATDELTVRSELCVTWLEHLLLLSMLQHPAGLWSWGLYVVVHPAGNASVAEGCARYRGLLVDDSTFVTTTLEELLGAGALPRRTTSALRERYLP